MQRTTQQYVSLGDYGLKIPKISQLTGSQTNIYAPNKAKFGSSMPNFTFIGAMCCPCSAKKQLQCGRTPVMAAQPNIGGALCKSSVIPFCVPRCKVWLTPADGVLCSNAANIGERNTWTQTEFYTWQNSVRTQDPRKCTYSVTAPETPNIVQYGWPPVSDIAAVMKARRETRWNLLGCPKLRNQSQLLVRQSLPHCAHMWRRYCCLTTFSDCQYMLYLRRHSSTKLCDGAQMANFWQFFGSCIFSEPCAAHSKFALRPHHVWKYGRHPVCNSWD